MTLPVRTGRYPVKGAGLALRRALLSPLRSRELDPVEFMEIAPENWMGVGGQRGRLLREYLDRLPFVCHGLSLSIGGPSPLDETFLHRLRHFLDAHAIRCYSEHLSYCTDEGHLYDLMPIPFTEEAVHHVAGRVRRVQDILERRIALENVSYYAAPGAELSEIEFITAVLQEADCDLLLDVNNIYVNSVNHRYDALEFLRSLPGERIAYGHIAGHFNEAEDLIIDTHGADVMASVWALLDQAYEAFGVFPTLLERDFNIPAADELLQEVARIRSLQEQHQDHAGDARRKQA
ncbi:MAG: HvfB family MNIO-type RiPP peptide maturase [Lysobacterales bacterium]